MENLNQQLIDKSLQSIDGIKRAEASPFLYAKIIHLLKSKMPAPVYYSGVWLARLTFAVVLIISINTFTVWVVTHKTTPAINEHVELQKMAIEYFGNDELDQLIY